MLVCVLVYLLRLLKPIKAAMGFIYVSTTPAVNTTDSLSNGMHCEFLSDKAVLGVYVATNVVLSVVHCNHNGVFL